MKGVAETEFRLLDPERHIFSDAHQLPDFGSSHRAWQPELSPTKQFLAYLRTPTLDELRRDDASSYPKAIVSSVVVYDLEKDRSQSFPIEAFVRLGSGVPFIFPYVDLWFSGPAELKVQSGIPRQTGRQQSLRVAEITVNLATGHRKDIPVDSLRPGPDRMAGLFVPRALGLIPPGCCPQEDLAFAFLKHQKVKVDRPEVCSQTKVVFSTDGKRFCMKMLGGQMRRSFFLGDLERRTLSRIESPAELWNDNDLEMRWVIP